MADRKITDLTEMAAGTQGSNDLLTIVDVSEGAAADKNKKITFDSLFKGIPGNVGIGIPSPGSKLHVRDNTAPPLEITRDQATNGSGILLRQPNTTDGNDLRISYQSDTTGTGAASNVNFAAIEFTSATHNNSTRAGEIGFYTAKGGEGFIQRMRIDSSGQVGIGTTSPDALLNISSTGNGYRFKIDDTTNDHTVGLYSDGTTPRFVSVNNAESSYKPLTLSGSDLRFWIGSDEKARIDSSGRLLRGTTSTSANANTVLQGSSGGTTGAARLFLQRGGAPANGQSMANIFFADNSSNEGAKISAVRDGGTWTSGSSHPTRLEFATTANSANSPTEHMRIDSSGRLLIGTSTAGAFSNRRVSIATSSGSTVLELRSATNGDSRIIFTDSTDSSNTGSYKGQILYNQTSDYMSFNTNGDNERMRIDNNGRLRVPGRGINVAGNSDISFSNYGFSGGGDTDGVLARHSGNAYFSVDDHFRIRDNVNNNENKEFDFNTNTGSAGADANWNSNNFDFAEMFEWSDGNPNAEDRIGYSVAVDGLTGKIKIAEEGDVPIGIVSGTASFVANAGEIQWAGRRQRDEWGRFVYEPAVTVDDEGNEVPLLDDEGNQRTKPAINPDWDEARFESYVPRSQRPEWACIGVIGQVYMRKDCPVDARWIKLKEIDSVKDLWLIR